MRGSQAECSIHRVYKHTRYLSTLTQNLDLVAQVHAWLTLDNDERLVKDATHNVVYEGSSQVVGSFLNSGVKVERIHALILTCGDFILGLGTEDLIISDAKDLSQEFLAVGVVGC